MLNIFLVVAVSPTNSATNSGIPDWALWTILSVLIIVAAAWIGTLPRRLAQDAIRNNQIKILTDLIPELERVIRVVLGDTMIVPPGEGLLIKVNKIFRILNRLSLAVENLERHVGFDIYPHAAGHNMHEEMDYDAHHPKDARNINGFIDETTIP